MCVIKSLCVCVCVVQALCVCAYACVRDSVVQGSVAVSVGHICHVTQHHWGHAVRSTQEVPRDADACDTVTGDCLRCLHNTHGSSCERCKPGYYGDALVQDCKGTCVVI